MQLCFCFNFVWNLDRRESEFLAIPKMDKLNASNKSYNWDDINVGDYNMNHSENFFGTYDLVLSTRCAFYS